MKYFKFKLTNIVEATITCRIRHCPMVLCPYSPMAFVALEPGVVVVVQSADLLLPTPVRIHPSAKVCTNHVAYS